MSGNCNPQPDDGEGVIRITLPSGGIVFLVRSLWTPLSSPEKAVIIDELDSEILLYSARQKP
jgi:hypothetical protein